MSGAIERMTSFPEPEGRRVVAPTMPTLSVTVMLEIGSAVINASTPAAAGA